MALGRTRAAFLGGIVVLAGCGATVALDHVDGGSSSGTSGNASSSGASGGSGSSGTSGQSTSSSGASGSTSGGASSGFNPDAGFDDASSNPTQCSDPGQETHADPDAGTCYGIYLITCGVIDSRVLCRCPVARCDCERLGVVHSVPYTGCATGCTAGLSEAYDACGFRRK